MLIYLAGGMSNVDWKDQTYWRYLVKEYFKESDMNTKVISPPDYYNFESPTHDNELEVMNFDINCIRACDIVLVNFNSPKSTGTAMELMLAKELRKPIIGVNTQRVDLHPWLTCCCDKLFDDLTRACQYISDYYEWKV